eukprot:Lankesteria_metandrocarpae@DN6025_c0_g1_i1.p1
MNTLIQKSSSVHTRLVTLGLATAGITTAVVLRLQPVSPSLGPSASFFAFGISPAIAFKVTKNDVLGTKPKQSASIKAPVTVFGASSAGTGGRRLSRRSTEPA